MPFSLSPFEEAERRKRLGLDNQQVSWETHPKKWQVLTGIMKALGHNVDLDERMYKTLSTTDTFNKVVKMIRENGFDSGVEDGDGLAKTLGELKDSVDTKVSAKAGMILNIIDNLTN